jgi:hypothetical protein
VALLVRATALLLLAGIAITFPIVGDNRIHTRTSDSERRHSGGRHPTAHSVCSICLPRTVQAPPACGHVCGVSIRSAIGPGIRPILEILVPARDREVRESSRDDG